MKHVNKLIWVTFRKEGIQISGGFDDPKLATGDEYDVLFRLSTDTSSF